MSVDLPVLLIVAHMSYGFDYGLVSGNNVYFGGTDTSVHILAANNVQYGDISWRSPFGRLQDQTLKPGVYFRGTRLWNWCAVLQWCLHLVRDFVLRQIAFMWALSQMAMMWVPL